jgi:hypothetical protein
MPRRDFDDDVIDRKLNSQGGKCPCCERSLYHVGCGWDAHHRDGDSSNDASSNCVLVCADCHHNCYHDQAGISRKPVRCRVMNPYD